MLEIRGLTKEFAAGEMAVRRVDLQIPEGQFFALLGPSGCGKTTLLRLIAGFETPTQGEIFHDGSRIDRLPPHQRNFNMVFQRYALFPHLDVRGNIEFGLRMKKLPPAEIRSRADEAIALVRLESFDHRDIQTLSGGQQQRVALARALVNRPRILLLDEPLSALDLKLRKEMQVELRAIQRKVGQTFIFVTHDQEEALTLADRVAVMNQGRVEQSGTSQEVYEKPRTRFVANFIGSANLIPETRTMIRPERVRLSAFDGTASMRANRYEGVIRDLIYHGSTTDFRVELVGAPARFLWVSEPNAREQKNTAWGAGARVWAEWSEEDAWILPDENADSSSNSSL
ncbi:MAG: ABC transporter ATP-binding protein [Oligoflexia bacterium]|nr:ABC transporter ATP-binding protein [Oligoflexia bacterium]